MNYNSEKIFGKIWKKTPTQMVIFLPVGAGLASIAVYRLSPLIHLIADLVDYRWTTEVASAAFAVATGGPLIIPPVIIQYLAQVGIHPVQYWDLFHQKEVILDLSLSKINIRPIPPKYSNFRIYSIKIQCFYILFHQNTIL